MLVNNCRELRPKYEGVCGIDYNKHLWRKIECLHFYKKHLGLVWEFRGEKKRREVLS